MVGQRLKGIAGQVGGFASSNVSDALVLAGAGAVSYGAWLVYPAAGFIVGGLLAMAAGFLAARGNG